MPKRTTAVAAAVGCVVSVISVLAALLAVGDAPPGPYAPTARSEPHARSEPAVRHETPRPLDGPVPDRPQHQGDAAAGNGAPDRKGTAGPSEPAPPTRPGVAAAVRQLVSEGQAPGAAALSRDGRGSWFGPAGLADLRSDRPMRAADRFRAGSLTKTFVATVVLQLAAERRLSLTDPVAVHLPGLVRGHGNDGRRITVRQLLDHTSGLYDYTHDPRIAQRLFRPDRAAHRPDRHTPEQLVRAALRHTPRFRPGTDYAYSNTDYILLGLVVEKVTGRPYAEEVRRRIIRPLDLTGTSFPGARTDLPQPHGRAYSTAPTADADRTESTSGPDAQDPPGGPASAEPADVTSLDPSGAGAAGEAVSTLGDLTRFLSALLGGRLLPAEQLGQMLDTSGSDGAYGLGLFPRRLTCGVTVWGHNGSIKGSYVQALGTRDGGHVLGYRVNTDTVPPARAETRLLEAEFCPTRRR
ncbi:serine hydrolase [Streptomyces sp. KR80]|uniref:serine hydrolase n=1 Tax=Streptomyces sp. KR80 TaxID=3457426 RepID=UPI003FD0CC26